MQNIALTTLIPHHNATSCVGWSRQNMPTIPPDTHVTTGAGQNTVAMGIKTCSTHRQSVNWKSHWLLKTLLWGGQLLDCQLPVINFTFIMLPGSSCPQRFTLWLPPTIPPSTWQLLYRDPSYRMEILNIMDLVRKSVSTILAYCWHTQLTSCVEVMWAVEHYISSALSLSTSNLGVSMSAIVQEILLVFYTISVH